MVVSLFRRADGQEAPAVTSESVAEATGLAYNPAVEAKGFTVEQFERVRSKKYPSQWALSDTLEKVQARF